MKKVVLLASLVISLVCLFALTVSAEECVHSDNWEVKFGDEGVYGDWEAINVCPQCGLVLGDKFYEPIIKSWGYSYFDGSFVQGFEVDTGALEEYKGYTGKNVEYGVIAGVVDVVGTAPVNADGTVSNEKAIVYNLSDKNTGHFDIKIANIPSSNYDKKIIACAYVINGDEVFYGDGKTIDSRVAGISYDEVVDMIDNGDIPKGFEEYRQLTPEEMDIIFEQYWWSNSSNYSVRNTTGNDPKKYASTRMFTRDELPEGSYAVVGGLWQVRPEVWRVDENGNVTQQKGSRPGNKGEGTYDIATWWTHNDTESDGLSEYVYMAFNISDVNGGFIDQMTAEGVAEAFKIYVPYDTKLAKNEVEKAKNISVKGMQLVEWDDTSFRFGKFYKSNAKSSALGGDDRFYASPLFDKETLPVGSVIEINAGWSYRDERWVASDEAGSGRGPMMDAYRIVVTEEFWGDYNYRGFNISTLTKETLSKADYETVANAFRIYVPVE